MSHVAAGVEKEVGGGDGSPPQLFAQGHHGEDAHTNPRNDKRVWSDAHVVFLVSEVAACTPDATIAAALGRTAGGVRDKLRKLLDGADECPAMVRDELLRLKRLRDEEAAAAAAAEGNRQPGSAHGSAVAGRAAMEQVVQQYRALAAHVQQIRGVVTRVEDLLMCLLAEHYDANQAVARMSGRADCENILHKVLAARLGPAATSNIARLAAIGRGPCRTPETEADLGAGAARVSPPFPSAPPPVASSQELVAGNP